MNRIKNIKHIYKKWGIIKAIAYMWSVIKYYTYFKSGLIKIKWKIQDKITAWPRYKKLYKLFGWRILLPWKYFRKLL